MLSAIEGAFATTLSLLFAGAASVASAVLAAGLVLALQRIAIVVLSLVAGPLIDRVGARNLLAPCVVVIVTGLLGIAHGAVYVSAVVVVIARAVLGTAGPVLATQEREGSTVERLAAFATWVDSGLAVGSLIGGFAVARFGMPALYDVLAAGIVAALAVHVMASRRPALRV